MSVGDLIFWLVFIILIYDIIIKILAKINIEKIEKQPTIHTNDVSFNEFDSILDEEDLSDLSEEELVSFNDLEIGEENENK